MVLHENKETNKILNYSSNINYSSIIGDYARSTVKPSYFFNHFVRRCNPR